LAVTGSTIYGWATQEDGTVTRVTFTGSNFTLAGGAEDEVPEETVAERISKVDKLLVEHKQDLSKKLEKRNRKYQGRFIDILTESIKPSKNISDDKVKIYDKNVKINKDINDMINGIDKMLD
jgi:hypothetical protein